MHQTWSRWPSLQINPSTSTTTKQTNKQTQMASTESVDIRKFSPFFTPLYCHSLKPATWLPSHSLPFPTARVWEWHWQRSRPQWLCNWKMPAWIPTSEPHLCALARQQLDTCYQPSPPGTHLTGRLCSHGGTHQKPGPIQLLVGLDQAPSSVTGLHQCTHCG